MLHVTSWVLGKQVLRWRLASWKFIKEYPLDQYLWKRKEGGRTEQREKVGCDTVWMKTSAFTLLRHWMQAAPGRGQTLGDESFLNWDHSKTTAEGCHLIALLALVKKFLILKGENTVSITLPRISLAYNNKHSFLAHSSTDCPGFCWTTLGWFRCEAVDWVQIWSMYVSSSID